MTDSYKVEFSDCGMVPEMSLARIMEIVENKVSDLTKDIKCDNITLHDQYQLMWVFTKQKIVTLRSPKWNETITITCEILKTERIKNYFLTQMIDSSGKVIVRSILESCLLNCESFRITKLSTVNLLPKESDEDVSFDFLNENPLKQAFEFSVTPSMLDYSKHMNNTKGIIRFYDTLTIEEYQEINSKPYVFIIQYCSQAVIHEKLVINTLKEENNYFFEIEKEDGKSVIKASLLLK
ncbi:MAG: acyl-ACP thioesterase domain-containing protein [Bacilli bacterium]